MEQAHVTDLKIVRSGCRETLSLPGAKVIYDLLTSDPRCHWEAVCIKIEPNETSGDEPMKDPLCEKLCMVLRGSLKIRVEAEIHPLHDWDTICFPAHFAHSWMELGKDTIEVI